MTGTILGPEVVALPQVKDAVATDLAWFSARHTIAVSSIGDAAVFLGDVRTGEVRRVATLNASRLLAVADPP